MSANPRVLVVSPDPIPSFARLDAQLLSASFDVEVLAVRGLTNLTRVRRSIRSVDALLVWFLGRNAVLPISLARFNHVPIVGVVGGFEVAWVREIGYGIRPGSVREQILKYMIEASDSIVTVSTFSHGEALRRYPEYSGKFVKIPNAVDADKFGLGVRGSRSGVVSVGAISGETIERKSLRLYIDAARAMPDIQFTLIGPATDQQGKDLVRSIPRNMTWLGELGHEMLAQRLQCASVYFQASVYESFCVSLCEAMACGCFPVISNLAALPEVAGSASNAMKALSVDSASDAIRAALSRPDSDRAIFRSRVVERFGIYDRQLKLTMTIQGAIARQNQS